MRLLAIIAALILAACTKPALTVPVPQFVKIPDTLTQSYPCGRPIVTNGDLLQAYAECVESNAKHEADKQAIRKLGSHPY